MKKFLSSLLLVSYLFTMAAPVHVWADESGQTAIALSPEPSVVLSGIQNGQVTVEQIGNVTNITALKDSIADFSRFGTLEGQILNIRILDETGALLDASPALFRILSGNATEFLGTQNINGTVFMTNANGFHFGAASSTNVSGNFVASTLGMSNSDFLAGQYALSQNPAFGSGFIWNEGQMQGTEGSAIALVANGVQNDGTIRANGGTIALATGNEVMLGMGSGVFSVEVSTPLDAPVYDLQGNRVNEAIRQNGTLQANGGAVILSARAREEVLDRAINHTGIIEANSILEKDGRVLLDGGDEGIVRVNGTIDANGDTNIQAGKIDVVGKNIELGARTWLSAKGKGQNSDGGRIVVFAQNDTHVDGQTIVDVSGGYVSGDGGFAEISAKNSLVMDGITVNANAIDGIAGTALFDPADFVISGNNYFNGGLASWTATNSITVAANAVISTRILASGVTDHVIGASGGNSGNISLDAPTITINSGAKLLAQADSGYVGGNVTLSATQNAVTVTPLINYNDSEAKITINNAMIKGRDITILATSTAGRTFTDGDSAIDWGIGLLNVSGGPSSLFSGGIAVAYSDAQVEVNSGSLIQGSNVKIKADAKSDATVTLLGGEGVMLGYAETVTTAKVTIDGATIKADNDVNIETFANSKTEVNATVANLGTRGQAPLAVTFAGADSTTTSEAIVKGTSNIEAGDDITIQADTHKFQNVNASGGAYSDGVLGIAVAISQSDSTTKASLGGTSKADGDIEVKAKMEADKNDVAAASAAGSGLVAGLVVGGLNGAINGVFDKKKPATTKDPESQPFGLAASFAYSDHTNTVTSEIANNASVKGKGDVKVNATSSERPETSAIASVDTANMTNDTKKNVAIAAAIVIGDFENNAEARIGTGATVDASKDVIVHAEALNPYSIQWDQISGVGDVLDKINPNLGVQNGLFTSWAQSSATGEDVGVAGSVNILTLENNAKSYIDTNANINQDATYTTNQQDVHVTADTSIESLNIAGNFGLNPVATGGAKGGIGVGYLEVDYINNTYAGIKTGAKVSAETVEVAADTITKNISIAESGGKGGQYGFNGAFSFQGIDNETVAQIDDGATLVTRADTGDGVLVHAKDESKILNIAGGISKAGNVGIGTSVSLNEIDRDTRSRIGNETGDLDSTTGSISSDSNVKVEAENTGLIGSYSLAAAIVMPDAKTPSAGNFGIGISGDVSLNKLRDNTSASIDDSDIKKATDVTVTSKAGGTIQSMSGAVTINTQSGTSVGLAGSFTNNDIVSNTNAFIDNSTVDATGDLKVEATNDSSITSINASGSGASAAGRAIAGSTAYNDILNTTQAYVLDSDVKNSKTATFKANDDSAILGVAGSIAGGGKGGSASGAVNNLITNNIKAYSKDSDIKSTGKITLDASATGTIEGYAASIGIATSGTGSSGSTSDNEIEQNVEAGVKGKKSLGVRSDSDITLKAVNSANVTLVAGNISASGQSGYGRSTGSNDIDNDTRVYVDGGRLDSKGKIDMTAEATGTMKVITVGGTGTAGNSLAAGVSDNDIRNITEVKIVSDSDVDATGDITMKASDTSTIQALGGVVSGGGNNSVGAVVSLNDVQNQILTTIDDSTVTTTGGAISLDAYAKSTIEALAASGAFGGQTGLSGAVTLNEISNDVMARIENGADVDASGKVEIEAYDESTIRSLAGAIVVGSNSLGGSVATNDISNEVYAYVDGSTVESTGNSAEVKATEKATIETVAVGGAFAGTNSLGGSVALNDIDNSTKAYVNTTDAVGVTGSVVKGALDVSFTAEDTSKIQSFAGQVGAAGSNAIAGAVATNDISNDTYAYGKNSTITATAGYAALKATNASTIETFGIAGGTAGTASLAGSVAINTIANDTQAYLDGSVTTADDTVVVAAKSKSTIQTLGGVLSAGGTAGIGGTAVLNTVDNTTKAWVGKTGAFNSIVKAKGVDAGTISKADGTTGTDTVNGLAVVAESFDDVDTKSATLAAGGVGSIAATVTVNLVENDTQAYIENTSVNNSMTSNSAQSVKVRAYSGTDVDMKGGGLSAGGAAGIGATVDKTTIANTTKAFIKGQNSVKAENGVEVKSTTDEKVNSIIASGGIGGSAAVTGSVAVIDVDSTNEASIENAAVDAKGDIKVLADDDVDIDGYAGSLSVGGVAGAGASVVVVNLENDTIARITDSKTNATGVTEVNADSTSDVTAYTASGNLGGYAGVGGAVTVNTIATTTKALINEVSGTTEINESSSYAGAGQDVKVIAKDTTKLSAKDGSISLGVAVGAGASIDVATVRNTATASIGDNTKVSADRDVLVQASSDKDIDSVTVAAAGGAGAGVAGSVSIINVGSAISGEGNTAAASTASFTDTAIGNTSVGTRAGSSDAANAANAKVTAQGSPSASDEFNTGAVVSQSTTASIGSNAIVDAGGDITVDADDITDVDVVAGSLAVGGFYGVGGAVGLVNLKSRTNATVGSSADLTAGDDITIDAKGTVNESIVQAIAGTAGQIALGAAYTKINSDNDATASIGNNAKIRKADQVQVLSENYSNIQAESYGASIGAGAVGVSLAEAVETGTASATLGTGVMVADTANSKTVNDLLVQAKDGNYVQAYTVAAAGGILAGSGSVATAKANANAAATVGSGSDIHAENDVTIKAYSRNNADADSIGVSIGGVAVGVALSTAETSPNVTASVADSVSGSGTKINAKRDVTVMADSDENANAYSKSAAGGLVGATGSDSTSRATPTVKAFVGNNNEVDAVRDILVRAYSITFSSAQAEGISAGALNVAASLASAITNATVQAYTGHSSKLRAGRNANILSTFNIFGDSQQLFHRTKSESNASAGGALIGATGTKSATSSTANVGAWISTGSLLKGGNDAKIVSNAQNSGYAQAVGKANGLLAGGYTGTEMTISNYAESVVYGTGTVEAGNNAAVTSKAVSDTYSNAQGGAGQNITGALESLFTGNFDASSIPSIATIGGVAGTTNVFNTAVARTETGSTVKGGNDATISTQASANVTANSYMSSTGVFVADAVAATDVYVDSDALTTVGGKVEAKTVKITAQNAIDINAVAQADVHADIAAGFATALTRVRVGDSNDPAEAKVILTSTSDILGTTSVLLQALNYQASQNLIVKAVAKAYGTFTATSSTLAEGTAYVDARIQQDSGSKIATGDLNGTVRNSYYMNRISEPTAETVVTKVIEVARTVVKEVCTWLPWPLDDLCDIVTEVVFDLVTVLDPSFENSDIAGSGINSVGNINMNGDIYNIGAQNRNVTINADGTVTGGTGTISGNDLILGDIQNDAQSKIRFTAESVNEAGTPNGTITGNAIIHLKKVLDEVKIVNNSLYNLVVGKINMISTNGGEPDVVYNAPTVTRYNIDSTINQAKLIIDNNGTGNVLFKESIKNYLADFTFENSGGSILANDNNVVFEASGAHLRADNGSLGTSSQRLNFRLVRADKLPDGTVNPNPAELDAFSYGDMYLGVTGVNTLISTAACAGCTPFTFDPNYVVNNIKLDQINTFGKADIKLEKGSLIDYKRIEHTGMTTQYDINSLTADKDVILGGQGTVLNVLGTVQSGLQDIDFTIDGANTYNHEASRSGGTVFLKDIAAGGGKITLTGSLKGNGTLKALDGYSHVNIYNNGVNDVQVGALDVNTRINKNITLNAPTGDTDVTNLEYDQVKVSTFGYSSGAVNVQNTNAAADVVITGTIGNSSGTTVINSLGGIVNGANGLIKAKDIQLIATGAIGEDGDAVMTDLQGGKLDATAGGDIFLTETVGDLNLGNIVSPSDVVLTSLTGGIKDASSDGFGEAVGGEADITAQTALLIAATGIGTSANGIEMRLANATGANTNGLFAANGGNGGVFVANESTVGKGLTIGTIGSQIGIDAKTGVTVLSGSPLDVDSDVEDNGGGDILLAALGNASADDVTLNANVIASGGNGKITIVAGDSVSQSAGKTVSAAGTGDIQMISGEDWTDGIQDQDGSATGSISQANTARVVAANGRVLADSRAGAAIASLETASNASDALTVRARNGAITDNGDTHTDLITGATGQATLSATTGIGSANFLETSIGHLNAVNTSSGNIQIQETVAGGDLGINQISQQGIGTVFVRTLDGALTVNAGQSGVSATSGETTLSAQGTGSNKDLLVNDSVTSTSGKINLDSTSRDVKFSSEGDTTSASGQVEVSAARDITLANGTVISNGTGEIDLLAGRDILMDASSTVQSGSGPIDFEANRTISVGDSALVDAGTGLIDFDATTGDILTGTSSIIRTTAGPVTFTADQNISIGNSALVDAGSGLIDFTASTHDITMAAGSLVTSSVGPIAFDASNNITMTDGAVVNAGNGTVEFDTANGNVTLGLVTTTSNASNAIDINAASAIIDADTDQNLDLVTGSAGQTILKATTGIGSGNTLETSIGDLDAVNTASGNIQIDELASGTNLGLNRVDQQGPGSVTIRTLDGNLTVNAGQSGVSATSGDVTLTAQGTGANDDLIVNDTVTTASGNINLNSTSRDILLAAAGDVTSASGNVTAQASRDISMEDGQITNAGSGKVHFTAGRDIALSSVQTTSSATDAVLLTATSGGVRDNGDTDTDIVAQQGTTTITANTGIGSANALETKMLNLSATTNTGNVRIDNTGALNIVTANGVSGVSIVDPLDLNAAYFITLRTFSPLTVTAGSPVVNHSGGDITLNALGNLSADDVTLDGDVLTDGGNGNILITAGDSVIINSGVTVSATGTGNITVAAGEDYTDGILDQDGNPDGDILMAGTGTVATEEGDILMDAARTFLVGVVNADSDNDDVRGDVTTFSRSGSTLDSNGPALNITADHLTMTAGDEIGASGDFLETKVRSLTARSNGSMYFDNLGDILVDMISTGGNIFLNSAGDIILGNIYAPKGRLELKSTGSFRSLSNSQLHLQALNIIRLTAAGFIGTSSNIINTQIFEPGFLSLLISGSSPDGLSANLTGNFTRFSLDIQSTPPGLALYNGFVVGGEKINLLTAAQALLYVDIFPKALYQVGRLADFPGFFNADTLNRPLSESINTDALDVIQAGTLSLVSKVFVPKPAPTPVFKPAAVSVPAPALAPAPSTAPVILPEPVATTPAVSAPLAPPTIQYPRRAKAKKSVVVPQQAPLTPSQIQAPVTFGPPAGSFGNRLFQQSVEEENASTKSDSSS